MPDALQICPNDHPPFQTICTNHAASLELLGYRVDTVFFERRAPAAAPRAIYLGATGRAAVRLLRERVRAGTYRLLLTHRYKGYLAGRRICEPGVPQISVAHEFGMFARPLRRLKQRLDRPGVMFAGVSEAVADDLRANLRRAEVAVLPNSVDPKRTLADRSAARTALGVPQEGLIIGVVGRLHPKKNPELALAGFEHARSRLPASAALVFVGEGELSGRLAQAAGAGVHLLGAVPGAARLMRAFDLLLFASSAREAFGMTLLEAMAAGVPVVCADRPGPRQVLGDLGRFFSGDSADDLAAVLAAAVADLSALGDRMSELGLQRVAERFSIEAVARRFRECLRDFSP